MHLSLQWYNKGYITDNIKVSKKYHIQCMYTFEGLTYESSNIKAVPSIPFTKVRVCLHFSTCVLHELKTKICLHIYITMYYIVETLTNISFICCVNILINYYNSRNVCHQ